MLSLFAAPASGGLCISQDMEGEWINAHGQGVIKYVFIHFPCPSSAPVPPDYMLPMVRVLEYCENGLCDWGEVKAHYRFLSTVPGFIQTTRVDVRFVCDIATKELVILRLSSEELLVSLSVDYTDESGFDDFSVVEYFEPRVCFTAPSGARVCLEKRAFLPMREREVEYRPRFYREDEIPDYKMFKRSK
jgi:hypothetical protein